MLVLSRRVGESVVIGGDVVVTVIDVRGGQVRIGVEAPSNVVVHREEVYRLIEEQGAADAGSGVPSDSPDPNTPA